MTGHLTNRQIEDLIIDGPDPETRNHLITCESCRSEWGCLDELLEQYKSSATLAANSMIVAQPQFTVAASRTRWRIFPLIWVCASVMLVGVSVPLYEHRRAEQQQRAAAIARDNLLLEQVDLEVSEPVPQPLESLRNLVVTQRKATSSQNDN